MEISNGYNIYMRQLKSRFGVKKHFFLCGIPRAGNTLFASLMMQNKKIAVTANSITPDIIHEIYLLKNREVFQNFPDEESIDRAMVNAYHGYYSDWDYEFILDRGPWGHPLNKTLLSYIFKELKFVVLIRPVIEVIASFIKLEKPKNIHERIEVLMGRYGIISGNLYSIKSLIDSNQKHVIVKYSDLVKQPNIEINKVCNFLNIPNFDIDVKNIKPFQINNIQYHDEKVGSINTHSLKSTIEKEDLTSTIKDLPQDVKDLAKAAELFF